MLRSNWKKYTLKFKRPAGTSRGKLTTKDSWFIFIFDDSDPQIVGIGECSLLKDLSIDDREDYEEKIEEVCENINNYSFYLDKGLLEFPSIRFGLEMALMDLGLIGNRGERILFPSDFTEGRDSIEINGLVWMGSFDFMRQQIIDKIESGFECIKLKIGAIDFAEELNLIKSIRKEFSAKDIEIRVDANGAFPVNEALEKLKLLSEFNLHSIEQPIKQGQWEQMAELCKKSPLHIALDEELIRVVNIKEKKKLLEIIRPQYIILKPSLLGGFKASEEWIYFWAVYSLGYVTRKYEDIIGGLKEYNPHYDRRHNINLVASYILGDKYDWEFNARWNFGSGFPFTLTQGFYPLNTFTGGIYTDYTVVNSELGIIYADLNTGRLPTYHRLDIGVKKTFTFGRYTKLEANVSVTNVYNRKNIFYSDRVTGETVYQLPIMPSAGLMFYF